MKVKVMALSGAAIMAVGGVAHAETGDWYAAVDLGYNWKSNYTSSSQNMTPMGSQALGGGPLKFDVATKNAAAFTGRLGYEISPRLRAELELSHREGNVASARVYNYAIDAEPRALCSVGFSPAAQLCGAPSGSIQQNSLMGNLIYSPFPESNLRPFVGIGVGIDSAVAKYSGQYSTFPAVLSVKGTDAQLAYQLMTGLSWSIRPGVNIDLTYRHMSPSAFKFKSSDTGLDVRDSYSGKFHNDTISIGARWTFGSTPPSPKPMPATESMPMPMAQPVPPPASAPAPVMATPIPAPQSAPIAEKPMRAQAVVMKAGHDSFIVYFDLNSSRVKGQSTQIVKKAAEYAQHSKVKSVVVSAYTDTTGSSRYNKRLSIMRAKAVAAMLHKDGLSLKKIKMKGFGDTHLAVKTKKGVAKRANRRASIQVNF